MVLSRLPVGKTGEHFLEWLAWRSCLTVMSLLGRGSRVYKKVNWSRQEELAMSSLLPWLGLQILPPDSCLEFLSGFFDGRLWCRRVSQQSCPSSPCCVWPGCFITFTKIQGTAALVKFPCYHRGNRWNSKALLVPRSQKETKGNCLFLGSEGDLLAQTWKLHICSYPLPLSHTTSNLEGFAVSWLGKWVLQCQLCKADYNLFCRLYNTVSCTLWVLREGGYSGEKRCLQLIPSPASGLRELPGIETLPWVTMVGLLLTDSTG